MQENKSLAQRGHTNTSLMVEIRAAVYILNMYLELPQGLVLLRFKRKS